MRTIAGTKHWMSVLLAAALTWSGDLRAQDDTPPATNLVDAPSAATNDLPQAEITASPEPIRRGPIVMILGTAELKPGESAEAVVAILGSAKAHGDVRDAVVAIGGDALAEGKVGDAVVAIGGNARLKGKVRDAVVAVAGDAEVEGEVGDAVVAFLGNVKIKPGSKVHGDVVSIGGKVEVAEGAKVDGKVVEVGAGEYPVLAPLRGLAAWFKDCLFKLRLLAPHAEWYWVVAGLFLVFYLLLAVAFPRPVAACLAQLSERPATTFLLGLLTKLLLPLIIVVLAMTVIGAVVVPFVSVAVFIAAAFGKVALMQYLGGKLCRIFGGAVARPVAALLVGFVLITLLYMVPVVSFLVYGITGIWALGGAVTAMFGGVGKESPKKPGPPPAVPPPAAAAPLAMIAPQPTNASAPSGGIPADASTTPSPVPPVALPVKPTLPAALSLPRAGFFERMGAAFLDVILVSILGALVGGPPLGLLVALAYFAGMWAWKGTTIGGIVLNLKVVRQDDQPVTFAVALVRGLAAAFSAIVLFLGFFWIIWDAEKQSWHDKIAGTVVVRLPRGMPLMCL
jgi:uncharacterized RDD family membrane protein YckC